VATAIRHGGIPLAVYHEPALADEVVLQAMPKVRWTYDASFDGPTLEGCRVEITTTAGARHQHECRFALGHPEDPMSADQRLAKFLDCTAAAATPLPRDRALRIADTVAALDTLKNIGPLVDLLQ